MLVIEVTVYLMFCDSLYTVLAATNTAEDSFAVQQAVH